MPTATTTLRVRYAETDAMGVVYYANYFVWFEVARVELLRATGSSYRDLEEGGISLPVIEAHCDYRRPARYDDEILVRADGRISSPARIEFAYEVTRRGDNGIVAVGRTAHAAVSRDGRPRRLPDRIVEVFT
jgi:acyl-CoA thioester hydrolase